MDVIIKQEDGEIKAILGDKTVGTMTIVHPDDTSGRRNFEIEWLSFWTGEDLERNRGFGIYEKIGLKQVMFRRTTTIQMYQHDCL